MICGVTRGKLDKCLYFFLADHCRPNALHRPDYLINVVEYSRKKLSLNSTSLSGFEPGTIFGVLTLVAVMSSKRTTLFLAFFSIVLSFRGIGTALPGNRTRDTLSKFWLSYKFFIISRNKHVKFGINRFIHPRAVSEHAYKHGLYLNFMREIKFSLS